MYEFVYTYGILGECLQNPQYIVAPLYVHGMYMYVHMCKCIDAFVPILKTGMGPVWSSKAVEVVR